MVKIINSNLDHKLPHDPRTIMQTPRKLNFVKIGVGVDAGLYWHQGLEFCLRNCFKNLKCSISISININIDGLPIYKSSNKTFWPVLVNIHEYTNIKPMAVGIFYGESKPENIHQYLTPFVDEISPILQNGILINGYELLVRIRCFICDSPARAFIKGTASYNAKEGCQKCNVVGKYSHVSGTVVFTKIGKPVRTDELFRAKHYVDHQKVETPLVKLPIDVIKDIIVADPLHLLELGVMKRLIHGWRTGNLGYDTKWSWQQQLQISEFLLKIKMPSEIHRDARTMKLFSSWKGLEFRNFLNYYGIVVLHNFLPKKNYEHFLQLFCATTICSANKYRCHLNVAKMLYNQFITDYKKLYGPQFLTSNVHNLQHIVDDVSRFGILSSISAYPFENSLFHIKRMLRTGKNPLAQIASRLTERLFITSFNYNETATPKGPAIRFGKSRTEIELNGFKLSNHSFKDMWFSARNMIYCMENAYEENCKYFIAGHEVDTRNDLFDYPFKSSFLNIFTANVSNIKSKPLTKVSVADIECKYVVIQQANENHAFIPLLHTIVD